MSAISLEPNPLLVARHDRPGPRYTSYPTADRFGPVAAADYEAALDRASRRASPISLYVHMPFCESLCTYCGCNVIITRSAGKLEAYLRRLLREVDLVADRLGERTRLAQLHLGGGTPNYYGIDQLTQLMDALRRRFTFEPGAEVAIEIDPRHGTPEQVRALRALGFTRLSMGIQDFDPRVQEAVRRIQPVAMVRALVEAAREAEFDSVNVDLIYGLPHQTRRGFAQTVRETLALQPDRVALYSFAHVPWLRRQQEAIDPATLPQGDEKLGIFRDSREAFLEAGYVGIGMDHFARPDDEIAIAQREGTLYRNFQGYTVRPAAVAGEFGELETVGLGLTSIGDVGGGFFQNAKDLKDYYKAIDAGRLPVERGFVRSADDEARRFVIAELMCNFRVREADLVARFGLSLARDFAPELAQLAPLEADGLVTRTPEGLTVTPIGKLFVRVVAMAFDRHLRERPAARPTFSRTV